MRQRQGNRDKERQRNRLDMKLHNDKSIWLACTSIVRAVGGNDAVAVHLQSLVTFEMHFLCALS